MIHIFMGMSSWQKSQFNLIKISAIDQKAEKCQSVHVLVLQTTVIHLEEQLFGLMNTAVHHMMNMIPEKGKNKIRILLVDWPVSKKMAKSSAMVEYATNT